MRRCGTESLFESGEAEEAEAGHIIRIAFESGVDNEFDYFLPEKFWPIEAGQRIEAPFGRSNKLQVGFCIASQIKQEESYISRSRGRKLKTIKRVVDEKPLLNGELLELARWISSYYVCPLGQVLAAMVPSAVKKGIGTKTEKYVYLTEAGRGLAEQLRGKKQKHIIELLQERTAFCQDSAVASKQILELAGCTAGPVKKLIQNEIIKVTSRTVFKSLPVIPEGLYLKEQEVVLNHDQEKALEHVNGQIEGASFGVTLLHGVTDSGKTEIYIRAIEEVIKKGKAAIILLPEIALTAQTVQRFSDRFGKIAVMHSGLTAAQRNVQWQKIKAGDADVVIGARSAVFAPLDNVGLIVVDEEHEPSYKQDTAPRYNGRDVAIKRAQLAKAHCLLGSATPSLETLHNCQSRKHFACVRLPERVNNLPMPQMRLVDLRHCDTKDGQVTLISEPLEEKLRKTLLRKEQAILLLNRRGYSNFIFCPSCKHTLHCRNCDVTLTFHKSRIGGGAVLHKHMDYGYAACHYCGAETLVVRKCPLCGKGMTMIGMGSQRLEEELARKFGQARIARVDSDSMQSRDYYRLLKDFGDGKIDILAGTQMLAKGLHFPNVTLVGIISADTCLYLPDFRVNERTFQLISQVAGRAGRSERGGVVFVQTFMAEQPAIKFALKTDFDGFIREELKHRKACNLPPFWRLAAVVMRDRDFEKLELAANSMRERIDSIIKCYGLNIKVRGPMEAVISRIQRYHRMQIIVQAPQAEIMGRLFSNLRTGSAVRPAVKIAVDVDPVNLL